MQSSPGKMEHSFIYQQKWNLKKASEQLLEPYSKYCIDIFPVFSMYLFGLKEIGRLRGATWA